MKKKRYLLLLLFGLLLPFASQIYAQEEEPILFYQMEPLDDSLFVRIQEEVFIDPPDPKAEIIADLRDPNNQTVSIKGVLYPFLAFKPETRARIQTYPFKLNLEETINYASVFTRVFSKIHVNKVTSPPTLHQISPTLSYINPFIQLFGGERFGIPLKNDIGLSFGMGTPYSGPLETNLVEINFHILGFFAGAYSAIDAFTDLKEVNNHNNLYGTFGYQMGYNIPFGNFLQVSYTDIMTKFTPTQLIKYTKYDTGSYHAKLLNQSYFNWEFRYPISFLGSTRAKIYFGQYLNEWHIGFTGRELSLAGSTFDFRFDAMPKSDVRQPQYVLDVLVQKIFESWAFSAFAIGPSAILGKTAKGQFAVTSVFLNLRIKVGTSL